MGAIKLHGWVAITDDFESMLICALRYSIGRETYMPGIAIDYISVISVKR